MNAEGRETDSFQISLFNPTLDNFGSSLVILCYRHAGADRRVDNLGSVDDLPDEGNSKSKFHGGNSSEMVILQGHPGSPLSSRLGAGGTHSGQGLYPGMLVFR